MDAPRPMLGQRRVSPPSAPPTPSPTPTSREEEPAKPVSGAAWLATPPRFRFDDIVLTDDTRRRLHALMARIEHHDTLYRLWDLGAVDPAGRRVAINLFGPPGTGKTMCAEGIAEKLGKPILTVSYAELESKYVGETPKNIVAAFEAARQSGAVLFFDEADSILGKRLTSVTQAADHGVNVSRSTMLLQLDRFEGVVIFATNLAKNYDGAFVRRILGHVEIALPDELGRTAIADRLLRPAMPRDAGVTAAAIAQESEGLSGGDLLQVVVGAATRAVHRAGEARRVTWDDVQGEIAAVRRAKVAVGRAEPVTTVTTVDNPPATPSEA